jgi:energy-coupling factor transporter ATP-binding protein EcfA2
MTAASSNDAMQDAVEDSEPPHPPAGDLSVEDLTIRYPGRREPALEGVSVEVPAGALVGVAGRTGAGKSTLALAAAGFIPRVVRARLGGRVMVAGLDTATADGSELLGRVGIVFATPANQLSASKLTVREELAFGLENLAVPRSEMDARIDATLARLGIGHLEGREPFALSGGEQQRVAIASIIAMGPSVLVLDEPTAQLDPFGTATVADLLQELAAGGAAVLVAEHDASVLARTERMIVLDRGRVAGSGPPGEALGPEVLGPLGLPSPTLVSLAALAGVGPDHAFDEAAIAAGLARVAAKDPDRLIDRGAGTTAVTMSNDLAGGTPAWRPIRDQPAIPIEIEKLTYRYAGSDVDAIRGVTLTIPPGEAVAILGLNGSGKTTVAKHLIGLLRPTSGRVLVGGDDIRDDPVHRLAGRIGFVFQNPDDQLFDRSVEREVSFGPRNIGLPTDAIQRLVETSLEAVGLTDARSTNPYDLDLSGRKLVALASVLALDPAVFVLDEPATGQDGPGVRRVGAIVDALRGAGRSVVAITHDMEFAAGHFGRAIVMREGSVILDGPPAVVFSEGNVDLLATAGIVPPPAARIGARLGLGSTPTEAALIDALRKRG